MSYSSNSLTCATVSAHPYTGMEDVKVSAREATAAVRLEFAYDIFIQLILVQEQENLNRPSLLESDCCRSG